MRCRRLTNPAGAKGALRAKAGFSWVRQAQHVQAAWARCSQRPKGAGWVPGDPRYPPTCSASRCLALPAADAPCKYQGCSEREGRFQVGKASARRGSVHLKPSCASCARLTHLKPAFALTAPLVLAGRVSHRQRKAAAGAARRGMPRIPRDPTSTLGTLAASIPGRLHVLSSAYPAKTSLHSQGTLGTCRVLQPPATQNSG